MQASRLLYMCLGWVTQGFEDGRIRTLIYQSRVDGHHTDDLVYEVVNSLGEGSRVHKMLDDFETKDQGELAILKSQVIISGTNLNVDGRGLALRKRDTRSRRFDAAYINTQLGDPARDIPIPRSDLECTPRTRFPHFG